jgi:acyl-coenzyme A thioesterase PaaI-like protein
MVVGQEIVFDDPETLCFGCSPHNERGLQVRFTHIGASKVEGRYTAAPHTCGAPGVVHGGVQAALLDEAIGFAVHARKLEDDPDTDPWKDPVVTAEFDLRYRRPVLVGAELVLRGEVLRVDGRDFYSVGEICAPDGEVLTFATARWVRISR